MVKSMEVGTYVRSLLVLTNWTNVGGSLNALAIIRPLQSSTELQVPYGWTTALVQ